MFWLENVIYFLVFLIFEILISPAAYVKIWYNILLIVRTTGIGTIGILRALLLCMVWTFLGPFIMVWITCMDMLNFVVILINHDGFTRTKEDKIAADKADDNLKV
jgi:hypothetical protein